MISNVEKSLFLNVKKLVFSNVEKWLSSNVENGCFRTSKMIVFKLQKMIVFKRGKKGCFEFWKSKEQNEGATVAQLSYFCVFQIWNICIISWNIFFFTFEYIEKQSEIKKYWLNHFEKSPIKSHRSCVLPPLKTHCFWWALISGWAFISANTVRFVERAPEKNRKVSPLGLDIALVQYILATYYRLFFLMFRRTNINSFIWFYM